MGEFSAVNAIKSIMSGIPSLCVKGFKLSEHLGQVLKNLKIDFGKEREMDIINISCKDNIVNIMFGECKVN